MNNKEKDKKFSKLAELMTKKRPNSKAYSEKEASENPIEYMEKMKQPSIKNSKGIAF